MSQDPREAQMNGMKTYHYRIKYDHIIRTLALELAEAEDEALFFHDKSEQVEWTKYIIDILDLTQEVITYRAARGV